MNGTALAWHWTIVVMVGMTFSFLNIFNRQENVRALRTRGIDDPDAVYAARWLRNTEIVRLIQLVVLFLLGVGGIYVSLAHPEFQRVSNSLEDLGLDLFTRLYLTQTGHAFLIFAYAITFNSIYAYFKTRRLRVLRAARNAEEAIAAEKRPMPMA